MDCGRGSLVKLCGLRGLNFAIHTPLWSHTAPALAYVPSCRPPTSSSAWIGMLLSGQSTHQTTWVASDVTGLMWRLWLTRNWSSCFNVICACLTARRPLVADKLSIQGLSGVIKRPSLRLLSPLCIVSNGRCVGLCALVTSCNCCCEFGLCQWATDMSDVRSFTILSDFMSFHDREASLALAYEVRY